MIFGSVVDLIIYDGFDLRLASCLFHGFIDEDTFDFFQSIGSEAI